MSSCTVRVGYLIFREIMIPMTHYYELSKLLAQLKYITERANPQANEKLDFALKTQRFERHALHYIEYGQPLFGDLYIVVKRTTYEHSWEREERRHQLEASPHCTSP